ncbi:MAG TPA: VCBS repeat-containing protein [Pyrinomonadaceae bacterium]
MRSSAKLKRAAARILVALFVLSCVPRAHAYHPHERNSPHQSQSPNSLIAASDFDADTRPDRATVHSNGPSKTIKIHFDNTRSARLAFTARSAESGKLVAGDIDRDGDVDLVWLETTDRKNAVVWINSGDGNFVEGDNSQYASELDDLFSGHDPSGNRSLKRKRKTSALASAFFHDIGLPFLCTVQDATISLVPVSIPDRLAVKSRFVAYLLKRGPPLSVS